MIQEDIDEAISISYTLTQLYNELQLLGYEYKISEKIFLLNIRLVDNLFD